MRVAGYIEHSRMKISILHMNHRYAVKFELAGMEQVYKIRESEAIQSVEDITTIVNNDILEEVENFFNNMESVRIKMLSANNPLLEDFEEII